MGRFGSTIMISLGVEGEGGVDILLETEPNIKNRLKEEPWTEVQISSLAQGLRTKMPLQWYIPRW